MKNRDYFLKTATIDFLMKINGNILRNAHCIIEAVEGKTRILCEQDCFKCLQKWLNEDKK